MRTNGTGTTPFPQYRAIADSLRQGIADGIHPPGTMLPSERELCDRFSVARGTARDGLRELVKERLAVAVHGRGYEVVRPPAEHLGRPPDPVAPRRARPRGGGPSPAGVRLVIDLAAGQGGPTDGVRERTGHLPPAVDGPGRPTRDLSEHYAPWQAMDEWFARGESDAMWAVRLERIEVQDGSVSRQEWTVPVDLATTRVRPYAAGARTRTHTQETVKGTNWRIRNARRLVRRSAGPGAV